MTQSTKSWIRVSSVELTDSDVIFRYADQSGQEFSVELRYDQPIKAALAAYPSAKIQKLLNYMALTQAMCVYNFGYYTEVIGLYKLTPSEAEFFRTLYFAGLAEFRLQNNIDLSTQVHFSGERDVAEVGEADADTSPSLHGTLVGNGGGKDGAVAAEIAHAVLDDPMWFTLNKSGKRQHIIDASPFQSQISVARSIEPSIYGQTYHGHKAVSSQIALMAVLSALINRKKYVAVANEYSSNEGNLVRDGISVNHQYTKSFAFEQDFQQLIDGLDLGVHYFSLVRPLYELQILRLFERYPVYHTLFVSCNHGVHEGHWCLECAKCAFMILGVTALDPSMAERVWGDKNIIAKPELREHITALVSPDIDKPFECVGTLGECQLALGMIYRNKDFFAQLPPDLQALITANQPQDFDALYRDLMLTYERENNIPDELRSDVYKYFQTHLR